MPRRSTSHEVTNGAASEVQAPTVPPAPPMAAPQMVAPPVPFPLPPLPPQPPSAPHSVRAQQAEAVDREEQLRIRKAALKALPKGVPITDVTVIIGYKTRQGRQEVIHDIGPDFRITTASHSVEEKVRPVTEQGQFLGMEPTGEYLLTLKVKYYNE